VIDSVLITKAGHRCGSGLQWRQHPRRCGTGSIRPSRRGTGGKM